MAEKSVGLKITADGAQAVTTLGEINQKVVGIKQTTDVLGKAQQSLFGRVATGAIAYNNILQSVTGTFGAISGAANKISQMSAAAGDLQL
jgi:hypothetical protein